VAEGSWWVGVWEEEGAAKGMKAGLSSSSSASPDCPSLFDENRGGRRRSRLCIGGSESEDEDEELSSGDDKGAGRGERVTGSMAKEFGRDLGFG
jgi:hypothetical protein